jgi:type II secretory pathway component PulJ
MKFATPATNARTAGFTLAEVLAAMLFLALVIPAAVEALHVAG